MGNNDVFAVIADKTRRGILTALKDGERPVGDLVAELGVSQPTVSKHLKILREAGMVSMEAQGQRRLYAVRPEPLAEVTEWVHGVVGGAAGPVVPADPGAAAGERAGMPPLAVPGATGGEPVSEPVEPAAEPAPLQDAAGASVPAQQQLVPLGADRAVEDSSPREGRGAGARAVGILSNLPGFRRRPRHRRR
ncbi:metalloregulator ArsR/SmtB family transcription factor [Kocuria sp. M1R5S2]|uniref:ArsR/SmtB family transcription factor n=1 Tax=Kocuria rhizosphaerae TaxID=3376285 RepID=UPI0037BD30C0